MNQILSVESPKREKRTRVRNNAPLEVNTILKMFSIVMIIFGVLMLGSGSYSMYQNSKSGLAQTKPTIYVEEISETELRLEVSHDKPLEKVTYNWNNDEPIEIDAKGKKKVEQVIEKIKGENTLNIYALDTKGQEINYPRTYTLQGDITINLEVDGNSLKIIANGKQELSYMTYRWDEDEETKIDINSASTEQNIDIPKGLHKLTIIVVDINNNTETKEQDVNGVNKPKLEVTTDGSDNFVIKASDEEGIKRVEFIINETEERKSLDLDRVLSLEERKEFEYSYPLHDGENKLEVRVYSESGASEVRKVLVRK